MNTFLMLWALWALWAAGGALMCGIALMTDKVELKDVPDVMIIITVCALFSAAFGPFAPAAAQMSVERT